MFFSVFSVVANLPTGLLSPRPVSWFTLGLERLVFALLLVESHRLLSFLLRPMSVSFLIFGIRGNSETSSLFAGGLLGCLTSGGFGGIGSFKLGDSGL